MNTLPGNSTRSSGQPPDLWHLITLAPQGGDALDNATLPNLVRLYISDNVRVPVLQDGRHLTL